MSDSLERTTDCLLSEDSSNQMEEKDKAGVVSELRWQDEGLSVELLRGMETLRVNRELTDVTICVQGHDFLCHRAILAAASQYFRYYKLFYTCNKACFWTFKIF